MLHTTNYNLSKPELTDTVGISIPALSGNMDLIEAQFLLMANNPYTIISHSGGGVQSIPNATGTVVVYDTEISGRGGMFSSGRINIIKAGLYIFGAVNYYLAGGAGYRNCSIRKNGTTRLTVNEIPSISSRDTAPQVSGMPCYCNVGDYFENLTEQGSGGGALNIYNYSPLTFFYAIKVG